MENGTTMAFGRRYKVGNYYVTKHSRALSRRELQELRQDIPLEIRRHLKRGSIPYIRVSAISGLWAVEFCFTTYMYMMLDRTVASCRDDDTVDLNHLFNLWFADVTILGDDEYYKQKAEAMNAFIARKKAAAVSDEEDARILDEVKASEEAKAVVVNMAKNVLKEEGDEGEQQDS